MRYHGKVSLVAALALTALAWHASAHAQINPFRGYKGPTLTREDRQAASSAAQTLLNREPASVGETETWTGPKTGNQGTFTIQRVFERSGMPCRTVVSQVVFKRTQTKRAFDLTVCRVA